MNNNASPLNIRAAAHGLLCRCEDEDCYVNIALDRLIAERNIGGRDRDFLSALVYGVTERKITLDYYISLLSSKKLEKLDTVVLTALRMGLYQIIYMDSVPDSAACNESVKLVRRKAASAAPFVNAVLRSFLRKREELRPPDREKHREEYLSVRYSVPPELVSLWDGQYGADITERILEGADTPPTVTLRANPLKITRDGLLSALEAEGIKAVPSPYSKYSVRLRGGASVGGLSLFAEGFCTVQDDASALACEALAPKPGDTVIDMCSAPGGKSFTAACLMEGKGKILSYELYEKKLSLISEGARRLGLDIITPIAHDASELIEDNIGTADCVICDVPCSGFGVIAKKPDMRARLSERIRDNTLPPLQAKILRNAALYVRKGGRLLYSTCTLNKHENEELVDAFLLESGEFSLVEERTLFPDPQRPIYERTDGFFYAVLKKNK